MDSGLGRVFLLAVYGLASTISIQPRIPFIWHNASKWMAVAVCLFHRQQLVWRRPRVLTGLSKGKMHHRPVFSLTIGVATQLALCLQPPAKLMFARGTESSCSYYDKPYDPKSSNSSEIYFLCYMSGAPLPSWLVWWWRGLRGGGETARSHVDFRTECWIMWALQNNLLIYHPITRWLCTGWVSVEWEEKKASLPKLADCGLSVREKPTPT